MQTLAATRYGSTDLFTATHWSVVIAAAAETPDSETSRAALAQLCETYWPPLYTYARARGHPPHDAQDLTQAFFAYLIEHRIYARTDREKGKFRSFLLGSFKNFLSDARDRETALKRGAGYEFVPLDAGRVDAAESLFQSRDSSFTESTVEDELYQRTWAKTLIGTALERTADAYKAEAKQSLFEHLKSFITAGPAPLPSYADLAAQLGLAESSVRSQVTRLRARYREILRAEVRRTVNSATEVEAELRELLRVLSRGA